VVIHGGFWRPAWDRAHAGPQSDGFADAGYVVATVEYRRVGWPGIFDDVALLTDAVPALVAEATAVDLARTILVGHSAGGHLALWAAARHLLPVTCPWQRSEPLPVAGVVALAGVADLALADEARLGGHATRDLLGGGRAEVPERYAVVDPAAQPRTGIRTVLVQGADDDDVPVEIARAYARRHPDASLRVLPGVGHFDLIDPTSDAWPTVLGAVAECADSGGAPPAPYPA
jgi:pimeloyl-ACP methyl ester carboxylesterase